MAKDDSRKKSAAPKAKAKSEASSKSKAPPPAGGNVAKTSARVRDADSVRRKTERRAPVVLPTGNERGTLTVLTGPDAGQVFAVEAEETILGRDPDVAVWLDDSSIGRHHARIVLKQGRHFIEDVQSVNGTLVNGRQTVRAELFSGDRIQIGPTMMRFNVSDETEEALQRRLYEQATRDPLTRVYLRAYFHERLKEDIAHALRHKQPLSVLLVRVDHYDEIVRTRGSLEGNRVLRNVARAISAIISVDDVLARYGSERFVLLARATELPVGMELADRVKLAVASVRPVDDGAAIVPSVTIGVACSSELGAVTGEHAARLVTLAAERLT